MIDSEKFILDCNSGKCNRSTIKSPQCKKEYKQKLCYAKYEKQLEKNKEKRELKYQEQKAEIEEYKRKKVSGEKIEYRDSDPKWTELRKQCLVRDNGQCRFFSIMTEEEKKLIRPHLWGDFKTLDGCHCISRSASVKLKYEIRNVYILYRRIHFCLDNCLDPFSGRSITKEERDNIWIRIIGVNEWGWLQNNK